MKMSGADQLKGKIKHLANIKGVDARTLFRIYMMERFLDRVSKSTYKDSFVLKGGMLIGYLIGVDLRTTMDIDTTIQNGYLSQEYVRDFIAEIISIDVNDGVMFTPIRYEEIMEGADYPGIRVSLEAKFDGTTTPVKIDITMGHPITPCAIENRFNALFAEPIRMLVYPLETIFAEKLQTVLVRGTLNTRMRDFYDLYMLFEFFGSELKKDDLRNAVKATFVARDSFDLLDDYVVLFAELRRSDTMQKLWGKYCENFTWAHNISWGQVLDRTEMLLDICVRG